MNREYDVVIVGAGHGGVHLATALVKGGYDGSVALVSAESAIPYERPPLSKGYLLGSESFDDIAFRTAAYWEKSPVELLLDSRVTEVRPGERRVVTEAGDEIGYGRLVWAAGGRARALPVPGHDLAGVHGIREIVGLDALRGELPGVKRAVIIGGGYIGLEAAAAFRTLGIEVTVIEVQDRLLARVTSPVISDFFLDLHRSAGVDVRLGTGVRELRGADGRVRSIVLDTGAEVPADLVVVGVGLLPNTELLAGAGAACGNGVEVDEFCRTDLPGISAIGDCASHSNPFAGGRRMRLESVQNATEQAKVVAADIAGDPRPYRVVPWFWSNQFKVRLKTVGIVSEYDELVVRGTPESGTFTVAYLSGGRIIALDCVNTAADFAHGKALVDHGANVKASMLADTSRPLKELLTRQPVA
ncbi:NAD(P)/FAD-dependent oxidoreductase [Streptosporangium sp. NPDC087985]|uniref:NAD(P)/FAD-dependent oxidoreductase n=1 Tax=Streptosporangium sp. NPDC087985 TaxID=3366196 RepID=UPI0038131C65